jgi:uncharacterized protein (DUF2267 family)
MSEQTPGPSAGPAERRFTAPVEKLFADLEASGALPSRMPAARAASAVLCVLSSQLGREQARRAAESLPGAVRPLWQQCRLHQGREREGADRQAFVRKVAEHLEVSFEEAEALARAVFASLRPHLSRWEAGRLADDLERDLAELWQSPGAP